MVLIKISNSDSDLKIDILFKSTLKKVGTRAAGQIIIKVAE